MTLLLGLVVALLVVLVGVFFYLWGRRGMAETALLRRSPSEAKNEVLPAKSSLLRQVHDSEIESHIRSGHLFDAIKLYREKNGVGLKEAKEAVEAWRNRLRAS
jgi:ribosomal protein L7/L12